MSETGPAATLHHIQLELRPELVDVEGLRVQRAATRDLQLDTGQVRHTKLFVLQGALGEAALQRLAHEGLADRVLHRVHIDSLLHDPGFASQVLVARQPGVTDDEGASARTALADQLETTPGDLPAVARLPQIFSQDLYLFERELADAEMQRLAEALLGNPLIHHFEPGRHGTAVTYAPAVQLAADPTVAAVSLELPDAELLALSKTRVLSLDLVEMQTIRDHYRDPATRARRQAVGLGADPSDCELEVFAQTWSEHCKHKEFRARIHYRDTASGETREIDGLFDSFVRAATSRVQERLAAAGRDWLVKVFSDNAGVVRIDAERLFVFKVETHNTPSALDPYGGAITGILGNNRDPLGTGRGGGRLLFNTDVLCFGPPDWDGPLLSGQLHPARVLRGVRKGIEDGGNKSGVPTVNGALVFDPRYRGKPLVYCGTGAILPAQHQGLDAWEKEILAGDRIVMIGGRVGQDGIHGATFSSVEIDKHSPRTAVQVGSPITQKKLSDFLEDACARGLVRCTTDNGAGGLASSIGELAPLSGGARVELDRVPLKYPGLRPWEIFVSESQERMTLAVDPALLEALLELAGDYEVEATDIGSFDSSGYLEVRHDGQPAALLDLDFLHDGVPGKEMWAEWTPPALTAPVLPADLDLGQALLALLASDDICSREAVIRQYDHEVKGKTVVKPLMGPTGQAPQDAAVLRYDHQGYAGLAVSNGILPRYGDLDPYQMSAGSFDEAVRQIVAVGGRLPDPDDPDGPWWSACDNFCLPDSAYHPEHNPDGKLKLAALVQMCQALLDVASAYGVPLTSGKDSMKNDFRADGEKISVPPTVLYSMVAAMPDVRRAVTTDFKAAGDTIYLLGESHDELGGSCLLRLHGQLGDRVPVLRVEQARDLYQRVSQASAQGLLASCHDLSDGGLAVAVAECAFGGQLGAELELADDATLGEVTQLFGESHSRFVASVAPEHLERFEALLGDRATQLGKVTAENRLRLGRGGRVLIDLELEALHAAWARGLEV